MIAAIYPEASNAFVDLRGHQVILPSIFEQAPGKMQSKVTGQLRFVRSSDKLSSGAQKGVRAG